MNDLPAIADLSFPLDERFPEQFVDLRGKLKCYIARAEELIDLLEDRALDYIHVSGAFEVGDVRYYEGIPKDVKCNNVPLAFRAILDATSGDLDAACACLSSDAIKHGAASKILPKDVYARLFTVIEKPCIKEAEPRTKLIEVNKSFAKG